MISKILQTGLATALLFVVSVAAVHAPQVQPPDMFRTAAVCMGCHNGLATPEGEDISFGLNWRPSMMANSARDPYWQAGVRREVTDHPSAQAAIEDECAKCHMPAARYQAHTRGELGQIFANLPVGRAGAPMAADGVSCTVCHQIMDEGLGTRESFVGGFIIDTTTPMGERSIFGPFAVDQGRTTLMKSASRFEQEEAPHMQSSEVCATCHTLYTHALGPDGEAIGELPEQVPYLEWKHSAYAAEQSCQSCHMPEVADSTNVTAVMGQPRANVSVHVFRGGNFFVPRMLNRYRKELGVAALPQELDAVALRTREHLQTQTAHLEVEHVTVSDEELRAAVAITNMAGHKLPSAYPSRRVWVHLTVRDGSGAVVFESGAIRPDGSIVGNDNDADADRYEPHYALIDREEKVQIYESIMADSDGNVTTGLLSAVRFTKDNRLLPRGFDKTTADDDIGVHGAASDDPDFMDEGDRVQYVIDLGGAQGPFRVDAELMYQPIAFRWAQNLDDYDTFETQRFVRYYDSMADHSAVVLAVASAAEGFGGTR